MTTSLPAGYRTYVVCDSDDDVRDPVRFLLPEDDEVQEQQKKEPSSAVAAPSPPQAPPAPIQQPPTPSSSTPLLLSPTSPCTPMRRPAPPKPIVTPNLGGVCTTPVRPLSATLNRIMVDTAPELAAHDKKSQRGLFVSQFHYDEQESAQFGPMMRVGIFYNDREHLLHMLGGPRGTKSFVIPRPPSVADVRREAAFHLQVNVVDVQVGYWSDRMSPEYIACDDALRRYLSAQARLVPFVHAFVTGCTESAAVEAARHPVEMEEEVQEEEEVQQQQQQQQQTAEEEEIQQKENEPLVLDAKEDEKEEQEAQQQQDESDKICNDNNSSDEETSSDDGFFDIPASKASAATPPPSALVALSSPTPKNPSSTAASKKTTNNVPTPPPRVQRPVSAPASRIAQQEQQQQEQQQNQNQPPPPPTATPSAAATVYRPSSAVQRRPTHQQQQLSAAVDNNTNNTIRVTPSLGSERGLAVLPPVPSASSMSSAWRLGVDCTPPTSFCYNDRGYLPSRPPSSARLLGPSSSLSMMGTLPQNLINLFDGGRVDESVIDKIYEQLVHQTKQVVLGSDYATRPTSVATTARTTSSRVGSPEPTKIEIGDGVLPSVLLDYLDVHLDDCGDRKRWERAIGHLMLRRRLSRDHVAYVLFKVSKE